MRAFWKTEALLFLGAIAVRVVFHTLTGFTADDAFITYRYAENILFGNGFVYNIGDHVLGTSTPLFTLLLATVGIIHTNLLNWSLLISLLASGGTAVVLYRFARSLRFSVFAVLPSLLYICWPRSLPADTSGMETALFTFFVLIAFYLRHKQQPIWAIAMATLATLTRIEGVLPLLLIVGASIRHDRSRLVQYIITPLFLLLPWGLFAWQYFGSPLPHSIAAKLALYSQFGTVSWVDTLIQLLWLNTPIGWLLLITAGFGLRWLIKTQNAGRLEAIWIVSMLLFFTFGNTHIFFWYIPPVYPLYLLIGSAVIPFFVDRISALRSCQQITAVIIGIACCICLLGADYFPVREYRKQAEELTSKHAAVGYYLRTHADKTDIVAAEDIGYMGYISKLQVIDRDGLVSPEVVPYNRASDYKGVILAFHPDWVVAAEHSPISTFLQDSNFTQSYDLAERFGTDEQSPYLIFRRKTLETP